MINIRLVHSIPRDIDVVPIEYQHYYMIYTETDTDINLYYIPKTLSALLYLIMTLPPGSRITDPYLLKFVSYKIEDHDVLHLAPVMYPPPQAIVDKFIKEEQYNEAISINHTYFSEDYVVVETIRNVIKKMVAEKFHDFAFIVSLDETQLTFASQVNTLTLDIYRDAVLVNIPIVAYAAYLLKTKPYYHDGTSDAIWEIKGINYKKPTIENAEVIKYSYGEI